MGFISKVARFFGIITVKQIGNQVRVTGIDGDVMKGFITKIWQTNVINKQMFTTINDTSFSFNKFFIPDVIYILSRIKDDPNCRWSGKHSIDKIIKGINENTWWKITTQEHQSITDPSRMKLLKWKPLPTQLNFLHLYGEKIPKYGLNGYILALGPGGGKTFSDLLVATCVIPPSVAEVKIIISPKKALHLVWEKSIRSVFHKTPTYWCCDSNDKMPLDKCEYYIFNFERLSQAYDLASFLKSKGVRYFIIVDESHNFADFKSLRTQALVKLQRLTENSYFIWTSGTPILKSAAELSSYLKCADPNNFDNDAEQRFKRIYSSSPGRANEIFNHRLGLMLAYTVPKSAFSESKPTVIELPVKLPPSVAHKFLMSSVRQEMKEFAKERLVFYEKEMKNLRRTVNDLLHYHESKLTTKAEYRDYNKYLKNIKIVSRNPDLNLRELNDEIRRYERNKLIPSLKPTDRKYYRSAISAIKNIKLKVRGEALGRILFKRRSECSAALAYYCKPDEIMKQSLSKTLFFASSVLPIKVLGNLLEKKGFIPLLVYGNTNADLVNIIDRFTEDPNVNPVCATMRSLSEAVPVTAASTVVLLDRPFRQATYEQVVSRADRIGQVHPVTVIEVTLDTGDEPNVSSTTDAILSDIRSVINELIGPEFAGPDPDEREYKDVIDASAEDEALFDLENNLEA